MSNEKQQAISQRREEIAALPRPSRLTDSDLRNEVAEVHETADLYRVYSRAWVTVYTSDAVGAAGESEAEALYREKYEGRVEPSHWRTRSCGADYSAVLELWLPVLRGEFKRREDAAEEAIRAADASKPEELTEAHVVVRNSAADYRLREYGIKKLQGGTS